MTARQAAVNLPPLGLGCAALGNLYAEVTDAAADATLAAALEGGVSYFDTAPYYGHGLSETRLGRFLAAVTSPVQVSTKVGRSLAPGAPDFETGFVKAAPYTPYFDYSRDAVFTQVEASLKRLGRATLDILFVHDIGEETHGEAHAERFNEALDGAFPALADLKAQGVTHAIGIGVNEIGICLQALAHTEVDFILLAGRYTLLEQDALDTLFPLCAERGTEIIVGGPFNSGVLAGGSHYNYAAAPAEVRQRVEALQAVCHAFDVPLAAAALQFPLAHPLVRSVIPGARSADEVRANIAHMARPVPADLWAEMKAQALLQLDAPVPEARP